jgi:predicted O-linked N-acetylglucosamine transferase (SPINDLY family)
MWTWPYRWPTDLPRLAALRAGLRQRMAGSPLCDGKRFAENLMRVLWYMAVDIITPGW